MEKIVGVVVVYFPDFSKLISNIDTYIDNLEQLFIVFNSPVSEQMFSRLQLKSSKFQLIINNANIGIALALNHTASIALNQGYEWMLTMDQDSYFPGSDFFDIFASTNKQDVAIFSPNPDSSLKINSENLKETDEVISVITSGNLLNLNIWNAIGGFEEKLFIDEVDNDYCLKAGFSGYKIVRFKNIQLFHTIGKTKEVPLLFKTHTIITHPPIRAYYIFRNNLYIFRTYKKKFPEYVRSRKIMLLKVLIKILLFSDKRVQNFKYICAGIWDYLNNSYGCYKSNSSEKILK